MGLADFLWTPYAIPVALILYYLVPYYSGNGALRDVPGPFLARVSNLWLLWQARKARRYLSVDEAHKKYGKLVRIQPNHVSIADEAAIPAIYGHGNGLLKSEYYNAFVSGSLSIFNMRDRAEHSRRRKVISHMFSNKSVSELEHYMCENIQTFVHQWDRLLVNAHGGYAKLDCLRWLGMLTLDIIGDLAHGQPFGMLKKGNDIIEIRKTPDSTPIYAPAVESLSRRGRASATIACLPHLAPYARYLPDPFYSQGINAVDNLARITINGVTQRLAGKSDPDRRDLLTHLIQGKDELGTGLTQPELNAEALMLLFAGSDTTSNTACSILYWILHTPHVLPKLRAELDAAMSVDVIIPTFDQVRALPYLQNVINESMRIYSTSSLGLPRVVPPGPGIAIFDRHFPAGTELSVPAYTIHHSEEIWGADVEEFVPERWGRLTERQKAAFIPFSLGPRSCIGRNVAMMELSLIIATIIHRWDFRLYTEPLESCEAFLKSPVECLIGIKMRE